MKFIIYVMLIRICNALEPMSEMEYTILFCGSLLVSVLEELKNSFKCKALIEKIKNINKVEKSFEVE